MRAPTREEHDAVVAAKGRPYTDHGMRPVKADVDGEQSQPTVLDQFVNEFLGGAA